MRLDDAVEFAEQRFGYKPGWDIEASQIDAEVLTFRIRMRVPDIKDGERIIPVTSHLNISLDTVERMDEHELLQTLVAEIRTMEVHEMDEWFAIDRRQIAGPHKVRNYVDRGARQEGGRRGDRTPNRAALARRSPDRKVFYGPSSLTMLSQTPDFGGSGTWKVVQAGEVRPMSLPRQGGGRWKHVLQEARRYFGASPAAGGGR